MATQRPISTISYNSEAFLRERLEEWREAHIIQSYMYIVHKGEDGDKDHIHVRIEPNKRVDVMDLSADLREFDPNHAKPRGVRPWRPSKEEDWMLYAVHDRDYLRQKYGGGERGEKLPYRWDDIKAPEDYDVETAYIRARAYLDHTTASVAKRIQSGASALDLMLEGENVYGVNAILRALSLTDYERVSAERDALSAQFNALLDAVTELGYIPVLNEENGLTLEKLPDKDEMKG